MSRQLTVTDWIRRHIDPPPATTADIELGRRKRDPHFARLRDLPHNAHVDELRDARLRMGYLRYEHVLGRGPYDTMGSAGTHLQEYFRAGNTEHLIDVLNLIELEWLYPSFERTWYGRPWDWHLDIAVALHQYRMWRNRGLLVVASRQTELEFLHPSHPQAHFSAIDTDTHHTRYL